VGVSLIRGILRAEPRLETLGSMGLERGGRQDRDLTWQRGDGGLGGPGIEVILLPTLPLQGRGCRIVLVCRGFGSGHPSPRIPDRTRHPQGWGGLGL
jgi:hypothetical protein